MHVSKIASKFLLWRLIKSESSVKAGCIVALTMALASNPAVATEAGAYITGWSTESGFRLKSVDQSGTADKFSFLIYAFENIYKSDDGNYRCASGHDIEDHDDGEGMRATLDYAYQFDAKESVDGSSDGATQALAGNFNQIRQLKLRHPHLKVLVALGGGSWSKWFSAAAATPALRRTLVASCVDLYLNGNLPMLDGHGGKGAAAGVFDGIDLDWEHPGLQGAPYNTVSADDKRNFTLLLAELRRQLDQLEKERGKHYLLTAAINSTAEHMSHTEPDKYVASLDWINLMTYDFHGAWKKNGPTDFQSNLYADPDNHGSDPQSIETAVRRFEAAGVPASKLVLGVPFYARGWAGVAPENHGLYQNAQGPAHGFEEGAESYARISKRTSGHKFYHPISKQLWTYDNGTFWTYDDPIVIREKVDYIRRQNLGGIMSWSLDQDDAQFSLSRAMLDIID